MGTTIVPEFEAGFKGAVPIDSIGSSGILVAKEQGPDHRSGIGLQLESCSCYENREPCT